MIYGILLAAGTSSRMGQPKQLLAWHGQPLVRYVASQALASQIAGLVVVLGAEACEVRKALIGLDGPLQLVENPVYATGQASSVRIGLAALPSTATGAVIFLVDQPLITPHLIDQLIAAFQSHPQAVAVIPRYQGQRGNPVILARTLFSAIQELQGDTGAREVLAAYAPHVQWVESADPAVVTDLDTPEEYAQLRAGK